jgi:F-type H+-transporting ATPase subunit b
MLIAEESAPKGVDLFLPEPAEIFWSFVVIAIIVAVFYKFVLPKMTEALNLRADNIEGEIANAAELKTQAEELHQRYTAEIKATKLEAAKILDAARAEATEIVANAKAKATADSETIIKNAYRAIEAERKVAETALKKEVGSLAMSITQKMLLNGIQNEERQSRMIDSSIDRFEHTLRRDHGTQTSRTSRTRTRRRVS